MPLMVPQFGPPPLPPAPPPRVKRAFEYRVEIVAHRDGTHSSNDTIPVHADDFLAVVTPLGLEGWEVIEIAGSMIYLKREISKPFIAEEHKEAFLSIKD
jgi:hypothetical protein